ncbi:MAG: hypothetical protein Q7T83_07190 [Thermodesulfovibrionales bacterium]|nr:hypothetical protein [Thermodesulfovibrionales bacterium]
MDKGKVSDITVEILISIRDEIKALRADTNNRFEQMDRRFENIERDIKDMKQDIRALVAHFEGDFLLLANKMGAIEGRRDAHLQEARH